MCVGSGHFTERTCARSGCRRRTDCSLGAARMLAARRCPPDMSVRREPRIPVSGCLHCSLILKDIRFILHDQSLRRKEPDAEEEVYKK